MTRAISRITMGGEMRSNSEWQDGKVAVRALSARFRWLALFATGVGLCGFRRPRNASELVIGREALQTLVVASVFKDQGRWYLAKGKCYAYLERPHVALEAARVIIDAHLSSLLGSLRSATPASARR